MTRWLDGSLAHHQWWRKFIGGDWYRVRVYGDMRNAFPGGECWFRGAKEDAAEQDREGWYTG